MVTALNKAGQGCRCIFHAVRVLMTHIHDRYIITAILVQGFSGFQTACLHDHIVSAGGIINTEVDPFLKPVRKGKYKQGLVALMLIPCQ